MIPNGQRLKMIAAIIDIFTILIVFPPYVLVGKIKCFTQELCKTT
jgi:hypothetical protein